MLECLLNVYMFSQRKRLKLNVHYILHLHSHRLAGGKFIRGYLICFPEIIESVDIMVFLYYLAIPYMACEYHLQFDGGMQSLAVLSLLASCYYWPWINCLQSAAVNKTVYDLLARHCLKLGRPWGQEVLLQLNNYHHQKGKWQASLKASSSYFRCHYWYLFISYIPCGKLQEVGEVISWFQTGLALTALPLHPCDCHFRVAALSGHIA